MAKTLEEYTAEISKSYDNTRNALNKQINAIEGNLAKTQNQINTSFANQQATLDRQRNNAASAASMQAAGSGGSFGGAANIANKKYYENSFVPAQTSLQTNQANALENAKTAADNNRLNLQTQLAALEDEVSKAAQQRYYEALEADRQERLARAQIAAQQAAMYGYGGYSGGGGGAQKYGANADASGGLQFFNNNTGGAVKFGTAYFGNGGAGGNGNILNAVGQSFGTGSAEYRRLSEILKYNSKKKLTNAAGSTKNYSYLSKYDSDLLNRLGLRLG
jgi:hypothetical protein